jgi:hypothetical protein
MKKINIAKLLKDCPKGMELDCTCADNVVFDKIIEYDQIKCVIGECRDPLILDKYGRLLHFCCPKCVIFPKGKTTWEGFQRPFKDGDVVAVTMIPEGIWIGIFKQYTAMFFESYCSLNTCVEFRNTGFTDHSLIGLRLATEEEKEKLFKAIKDNGYKWNSKTNTLEKLPKFKDGDILTNKIGSVFIYKGPMYYNKQLADFYCAYRISDKAFVPKLFKDKHFGDTLECRFASDEEKLKLFDIIKENGYKWNAETKTLEKLIEPKFKVGDRIKYRNGEIVHRVVQITEDTYVLDNLCSIPTSIEYMYNLVPNKFDISTLKPFDKVLVRDYNTHNWRCTLYERYLKTENSMRFATIIGHYQQCIPYENNEHLLGTTNDCDDFYKTWE